MISKTATRPKPLERAKPLEQLGGVRVDESPVHVPPVVQAEQAPVPSGSDVAHKKGPLPGVPVKNVRQALLDGVKGARGTKEVAAKPLDGPALLAKRLDEIERLVKSGETVRCVFDLDNTIFDCRGRTLHALQVFDAENGTHYADKLDLHDMLEDGRKTAISLKLPNDVVEAVGTVWDREFWDPKNLVHDTLIDSMVELAKEAKKRGAELVFLTGRTEDHGFREPTRAALARAGLDVPESEDRRLLLKPGLHERTAPYKEREMHQLLEDATLGFFVTEGRRDMDHLAKFVGDKFTGFLLDSTFEEGGPACKGVPVLPGTM